MWKEAVIAAVRGVRNQWVIVVGQKIAGILLSQVVLGQVLW